jgi:hypothetical protein
MKSKLSPAGVGLMSQLWKQHAGDSRLREERVHRRFHAVAYCCSALGRAPTIPESSAILNSEIMKSDSTPVAVLQNEDVSELSPLGVKLRERIKS